MGGGGAVGLMEERGKGLQTAPSPSGDDRRRRRRRRRSCRSMKASLEAPATTDVFFVPPDGSLPRRGERHPDTTWSSFLPMVGRDQIRGVAAWRAVGDKKGFKEASLRQADSPSDGASRDRPAKVLGSTTRPFALLSATCAVLPRPCACLTG